MKLLPNVIHCIIHCISLKAATVRGWSNTSEHSAFCLACGQPRFDPQHPIWLPQAPPEVIPESWARSNPWTSLGMTQRKIKQTLLLFCWIYRLHFCCFVEFIIYSLFSFMNMNLIYVCDKITVTCTYMYLWMSFLLF